MRQFEIEWPDFKVTVTADLNEKENPKLCEEFWKAMPFQTIFAASMSAGEMFKVPIPVSLADETGAVLRHFPAEPPGSILSLGFMGSLLVKYGVVAEPFKIPRIGLISSADLVKFQPVAVKLRDAYFFTKVVNMATFRRKKETR
jgi:hypothetical protein